MLLAPMKISTRICTSARETHPSPRHAFVGRGKTRDKATQPRPDCYLVHKTSTYGQDLCTTNDRCGMWKTRFCCELRGKTSAGALTIFGEWDFQWHGLLIFSKRIACFFGKSEEGCSHFTHLSPKASNTLLILLRTYRIKFRVGVSIVMFLFLKPSQLVIEFIKRKCLTLLVLLYHPAL